jgi:hypothetical protein
MRGRARPGALAALAPGTTSTFAGRTWSLRLIAAMLIVAAALDITRCSLVLMTFRHVTPAVGLVAAGLGAAAVSVSAARGCRAGRRWAGWAALLIGLASAPQASASGFHSPYMIPDVATAVLGILLTVVVLATAGRNQRPSQHLEVPCVMPRHGRRFGPLPAVDQSVSPSSPDPGDAGSPVRDRLWLHGTSSTCESSRESP